MFYKKRSFSIVPVRCDITIRPRSASYKAITMKTQHLTTPSPVIIGLTGGIGSGKSSVAKLFEQWGAMVVDADVLAREIVAPGSQTLHSIQEAFQDQEVLLEDGSLDRAKLASIIFNDSQKRAELEAIMHPAIRQIWLQRLANLKSRAPLMIVYVAPLLFESDQPSPELQSIVLVTAPEDLRIQRVTQRDGIPKTAAMQRMAAQLSDEAKSKRSNYIIANDSTFETLARRSKKVFEELLASAH